jgi:pantoate kinase
MIKAFAPGNVSCIFRIVDSKDNRHSLGVGFTVDKGVNVSVSKSNKVRVYVNGKKMRFPTVLMVVKELTNSGVKVEIKDSLPSGVGFGVSGASALATAYAVNKLLKLGKSKKELAMVAHRAEVVNGTGLGDVGGQFKGGFNMKAKKGKPFSGVNLGIKGVNVYYSFFGKIKTKNVINSKLKKKRINKAGDRALKRVKLLRNKTLKDIIRISKDFSLESGLLKNKKVKCLIKNIENKGGNASMIMLGNAVFADIPFKGCKKLRIIEKGACLI